MESLQFWEIILFDEFSFIVHLFDDSYRCRSGIDAMALVLRGNSPKCPRVRGTDWFTFKDNCRCSSNQWSIDNEWMSNYPANVTCWKESRVNMNIKNLVHCPVKSNYCSTSVSNYSFRLSCCTWCIKDIELMIRIEGNCLSMRSFSLHFDMIVKPMWILSKFVFYVNIMSLYYQTFSSLFINAY